MVNSKYNIKNSYKINKIITESIDNLLMEELGISEEVNNMTDIVYDKIIEDKNNGNNLGNGIIQFKGSISLNIFGIDINIIYTLYAFKDFESFSFFIRKNYTDMLCYIDYDNKKIVLNIVDDEYDTRYSKASIMHELLHLYQMSFTNKSLLNDKNKNIYQIAIDNFHNDNPIIKGISTAIYLSNQSEQSAYCQEVYKFLMKNHDSYKDIQCLLKLTNAYNLLNILKNTISNITTLDKIPNEIINIFKHNDLNWYINILNKTYKSFKSKVYKAYTKAKNDIAKEEYWKNPTLKVW